MTIEILFLNNCKNTCLMVCIIFSIHVKTNLELSKGYLMKMFYNQILLNIFRILTEKLHIDHIYNKYIQTTNVF